MKKSLISAVVLAAASTPALAGGSTPGGASSGARALSFVVAPVVSTNTVNQTALAMPLDTTTTAIMGGGATTGNVTSLTSQRANAMNVFSSGISSTIGY